MSDDFKMLIAKVASGHALTRDESSHAFDRMMSGEATPSQMGAMLMAMRVRGETVDEITGAASTMRDKMTRVAAPPGPSPAGPASSCAGRAGVDPWLKTGRPSGRG